eukprot:m.329745 g.329745  ORF g.329745 m.329745 type:complete len:93 (+) comp16511_c1_seq9:362-640(+)
MQEVWAREQPYQEIEASPSDFFETLGKVVVEGGRPLEPEGISAPDGFRELMHACWAHNPSEKPTFHEMRKRLDKMCFQNTYEDDPSQLDTSF